MSRRFDRAEIVTWKVKVGDVVTLNQPLVDIETAKATVELPSPYAGTVTALHGNVGDVLEVHKPLITFDVGGSAGASPAVPATPAEPSEPAPANAATDKQEGSVGEGREAVLIDTAWQMKTRSSRASTVVKVDRPHRPPLPHRPPHRPCKLLRFRPCRRSHHDPRPPFVSTPNNTASTSRR